MELYPHSNYEWYVGVQQRLTGKKTRYGTKSLSFVDKPMAENINNLIHSYVPEIKLMVCHGCRSGEEVHFFQELNPNAEVFGTDIYRKAYHYDRNYFLWMDFDHVPCDWLGRFDVVYSNCIDHSRNPLNTLLAWRSELKNDGICFVDFYYTKDKIITKEDCFQLDPVNYLPEIHQIADDVNMDVLYISEPFSFVKNAYGVDVIFRKVA